jgi:hypothetical protein
MSDETDGSEEIDFVETVLFRARDGLLVLAAELDPHKDACMTQGDIDGYRLLVDCGWDIAKAAENIEDRLRAIGAVRAPEYSAFTPRS